MLIFLDLFLDKQKFNSVYDTVSYMSKMESFWIGLNCVVGPQKCCESVGNLYPSKGTITPKGMT